MRYFILPFVIVFGLSAAGLHYLTSTARADAAAETRAALDAGIAPDPVVAADHAPHAKDAPPTLPADPIASPGETWTGLRYFYGLGWLPFGLAALCIACAVVAVRMRPADVDGDGLPDPSKSAKGYGWIAASALVVILPVLAMRLGDVEGITWSLVFNACGVGGLMAWGFLQRMGKATAASKVVSPGGNS